MGTRSLIGFITAERGFKGSYNQFDGYPLGVGMDLQKELKPLVDDDAKVEEVIALANAVTLVDRTAKPSAEQRLKAEVAGVVNCGVSTGKDWYSTLREHQGSLLMRLQYGTMTDDTDFVKYSLFCEYGYILDLREAAPKMIILEGFNKSKDEWEFAKAGQGHRYRGCSVLWDGDLAEFVEIDMASLEGTED